MGKKNIAGAKSKRPFAGEVMFNHMGASWFVSYAYYVYVKHSHSNWNKVPLPKRLYLFEKTVPYHLYWLEKIDPMNDRKLDANEIDLSPAEVKEMAKKILAKFW